MFLKKRLFKFKCFSYILLNIQWINHNHEYSIMYCIKSWAACIITPLHTHTHTQKQSMWGFPLLADGNKKHKAVCIGVNYVAKTAAGS